MEYIGEKQFENKTDAEKVAEDITRTTGIKHIAVKSNAYGKGEEILWTVKEEGE